jgi:hypothetical protein
VFDSLQAMSLLTIMEIIGPILLFAVLIYGTMQWSRRRRGPTQAAREASTRELYREGARMDEEEPEEATASAHAQRRLALEPSAEPSSFLSSFFLRGASS